MQIDLVRVHELQSYLDTYDNLPSSIVPMGKMRARSQSLNPCASPDDVALVVARQEGVCVGYAGLLPGKLACPSGISKVSWSSTFYVNPRFRHQMIAFALVKQVLALDIDFVATWFNRDVGGIYERMGCLPLAALVSRELRFVNAAPRRFFSRVIRKLGGPELSSQRRPAESVISRRTAYSLARRALAPGGKDWRAEKVEIVRNLPVSRSAGRPRFLRDAAVINWMLNNPWYEVNAVIPPSRYFFPETVTHFHFEAREFYDPGGEYAGYWVARVKTEEGDLTLRVTDWDLSSDSSEGRRAMLRSAIETAAQWSVGVMEVPEEWRLGVLQLPLYLEAHPTREYLYHARDPESPLARNAGNLYLQLGDGDYAFG
jgi:hypothetical protein